MTLPVWIIPAGCQSQITLVQCRGAKSHVYDMYTGQGVVSSRAVFVYCDLLRLSFDRVFCLPILLTYFNRPFLCRKELTNFNDSMKSNFNDLIIFSKANINVYIRTYFMYVCIYMSNCLRFRKCCSY